VLSFISDDLAYWRRQSRRGLSDSAGGWDQSLVRDRRKRWLGARGFFVEKSVLAQELNLTAAEPPNGQRVTASSAFSPRGRAGKE
jgi:hypothetical protein